ncbi:hypothetical protein CDL15_Pgr024041 [Punica granatum]|uniref:U-box domain-containing protein 33-like n=1 Tax=Punica granatum TaxID=22663 RepID=A0A218XXD2_PUNGR|nr:hypothetical protein CDL15_Pgr024041 [Punica granatum]
MELLKPFHPHLNPAGGDPLPRFSSPDSFSREVDRAAGFHEVPGGMEKVYVAVGRSVDKAVALIHWSSERFSGREICLVHVHQPSPLIPTLLGKLPAIQANPEVVSAYRRQEREQMKKLLHNYLIKCRAFKAKVSFITIEADQVQKGIVDMVNKYGIRRLVIGAVPENCMSIKKSSSKANYAAKNAPPFCEILFVYKGKHIWTRDALEEPVALAAPSNTEPEISPEFVQHNPTDIRRTSIESWLQRESVYSDMAVPATANICLPNYNQILFSTTNSSTCSSSSAERRVSSDSDLRIDEENLNSRLREALLQAEASRNEAFQELMKRRKLESEAVEVIEKVKALETAYLTESKTRKEAEDALRDTLQGQEKFLEEREEVGRELQRTMRNVALLDTRAQEANQRREEAVRELQVIQASIATLQLEKQRIRRQKMEAVHWLDRWRSRGQSRAVRCNGFVGLHEDFPELAEFSLSEVQSATCNLSESFKLGQSGFGCVYKGELLGRTVAIKLLHPHNMQGQFEFQQEVQVLGKLQHPHLVTLLGACSEAWSLVYEYQPNGSLQDQLFRKSKSSPLPWKDRVRIIAEISSGLCYLHSSKPEKIVHGALKPENILLDSELKCKICDFGICRLVTEETLHYPSFRRVTEPKNAFPYTDPEFYRTGILTPKCDVYALGLIILQLLTGRPPNGLIAEVRRAVSIGKLDTLLDSSAGEWPMKAVKILAELSLQCCELQSRNRPEVIPTLVKELEQLYISEERPVPSFFFCPIFQEIMHDPQIAADGFTYEGEAIRGWLENGRETSPMTNLNLEHLHLTPNHALRQAIQDWLCRP